MVFFWFASLITVRDDGLTTTAAGASSDLCTVVGLLPLLTSGVCLGLQGIRPRRRNSEFVHLKVTQEVSDVVPQHRVQLGQLLATSIAGDIRPLPSVRFGA
jgi:hypothetical protein